MRVQVLIVGLGKILDASLLAVLYIVPFAIWGQNIFKGLLFRCNDDTVKTKVRAWSSFARFASRTARG